MHTRENLWREAPFAELVQLDPGRPCLELPDLCKLLPNQEGRRLVAEFGHITHDFLARFAQCGLEVADSLEVQERLDRVWAGIHRLVWLGNALDPADGVA